MSTYTVELNDTLVNDTLVNNTRVNNTRGNEIRGRSPNKSDNFKRSKSESKNINAMFCPYCNINFQTEGRFKIHYETQVHKNNLIKCKKPINLFKLEKSL